MRLKPHAFFLGSLILMSIVMYAAQTPVSVFDLNSDMHNIAAVASAKADPGRYGKDHYLRVSSRFDNYIPLYLWGIQLAAGPDGDYPGATALLAVVSSIMFGTGCYLLFWRVSGGRVIAFGIAVTFGLARIWFQLGEKWSMSEAWGTMPRTQFTAFLPWLLLAAWEWRHQPRRWPVIGGLAAALIHIHPVSAPAWGLAIWTGLVFGTWPMVAAKQRLAWGGVAAGVALLVAAPVLKQHLAPRLLVARVDSNQVDIASPPKRAMLAAMSADEPDRSSDAKTSPEDQADELMEIRRSRYSPGLLDIRRGFGLVWNDIMGRNQDPRFDHRWIALWCLLWALSGVGVGLTERETRRDLVPVGLGLIAFIVPTVVVPLVDSARAAATERIPQFYDLARMIRFWPFGMTLIGAVGFGALNRGPRSETTWRTLCRWLLPVVAVPTMLGAFWYQLRGTPGDEPESWSEFRVGPLKYVLDDQTVRQERNEAVAELVAFIRENTANNAGFAVPPRTYWLRHTPGRPVVHTWKEGTTLSSNYAEASAWKERVTQHRMIQGWDRLIAKRWSEFRAAQGRVAEDDLRRAVDELQRMRAEVWNRKVRIWREWGADYALQPIWARPPRPVSVEFENEMYYVARVTPTPDA